MSHLATLSDYVRPSTTDSAPSKLALDAVAAALSAKQAEEEEVRLLFNGMVKNYGHCRNRLARNKKIIRRNLIPDPVGVDEERLGTEDLVWVKRHNMEENETTYDNGNDTDLEIEEVFDGYDHSGKTAYIEACQRSRVVPVSYYLRHMTDPELKLRHHQLGSHGVKPIAISLVSNAKILSLDLTDNGIGYHGAQVLCDMLRENCFITHLNLSENPLGASSAEILCDILQTTTSLTHVTLSDCGFDDKAAVFFMEAMMNTTKLEYLNLSHNKLSEVAGVILGPAIAENSSIQELDLSWNSLRRKGAIAVANGLKYNIMIKKVNLSWNGFGVDGCRELGKALMENTTLQELDISNNRVTTEAAVLLGKGLMVNESMCTIKMGHNPMQSAGCWAICSAILKNPHMKIKEIEFQNILVNRDFKEMERELIEKIPGIGIRHGGSAAPPKPKARTHPMVKLQNYITKHSLKLIDFFQKFDVDGSMSVSYSEFQEGLEEMGINLEKEEVDLLIEELDKDGDGEINYRKALISHGLASITPS